MTAKWWVQGRDHTLYALEGGRVTFARSRQAGRRSVSVEQVAPPPELTVPRTPTHLLRAARQITRQQQRAAM